MGKCSSLSSALSYTFPNIQPTNHTKNRSVSPPNASIRRSRKKGHQRRTCSLRCKSTVTHEPLPHSSGNTVSNSPCGPPQSYCPKTGCRRSAQTDLFHAPHGFTVITGSPLATACRVAPSSCLRCRCFSASYPNFPTRLAVGINQHLSSSHRHQTGSLRIPLVPTNQDSQFANRCLNRFETQIAGRKVEFTQRSTVKPGRPGCASSGTCPPSNHLSR